MGIINILYFLTILKAIIYTFTARIENILNGILIKFL